MNGSRGSEKGVGGRGREIVFISSYLLNQALDVSIQHEVGKGRPGDKDLVDVSGKTGSGMRGTRGNIELVRACQGGKGCGRPMKGAFRAFSVIGARSRGSSPTTMLDVPAQNQDGSLLLNCLIEGESIVFPVTVGRDHKVSDLKKAIQIERNWVA
jgi:hypothetical protein